MLRSSHVPVRLGDANRGHIALHHVSTGEVEEVLKAQPLEVDFYELNGEDRVEEVGPTAAGRILHIVTVVRNGQIRVVTALTQLGLSNCDFWNINGDSMNEKRQLPAFASEAEEARWWYDNREARGEEFAHTIQDGRAKPSSLAARITASRETIKVNPDDVTAAHELARLLGQDYQPFVERVFHEALERERSQTR